MVLHSVLDKVWLNPRLCEHMHYHQGILDQFNPSLKNFVAMGKHYEKALTGQSEVTHRFMGERRTNLL